MTSPNDDALARILCDFCIKSDEALLQLHKGVGSQITMTDAFKEQALKRLDHA